MKLFQSIQKSYAIVGISRGQRPLNIKSLAVAFALCSSTASNIVLLFRGPGNFNEFTDMIYVISLNMLANIYFCYSIVNMEFFFKFIDSCEKIVDKSK